MTSPTSQPRTHSLYHAASGSAFTALGALGLTFIAWGTFFIASLAAFLLNLPLLLSMGVGQLAMLLVPLIAVAATKRDARSVALVRPRSRYLLAAALVGSSLWLVNLAIVHWLSLPDEVPGMRTAIDTPPLWLVLLIVGLLPAVCEEVVFRGVLLRGLGTQFHPWVAGLLSAVIFAGYHLSLAQLVPMLIVGMVFALLALRSGSTAPTMLAHALNNCIALLFIRHEIPWLANRDATGLLDRQPAIAVALAGVLAVAGITLAVTGESRA